MNHRIINNNFNNEIKKLYNLLHLEDTCGLIYYTEIITVLTMDATKGSEFWLEASLRRQAATFTLLQAEMACL